jgi:CubicO group peptidase (beta-lactamase class C family)
MPGYAGDYARKEVPAVADPGNPDPASAYPASADPGRANPTHSDPSHSAPAASDLAALDQLARDFQDRDGQPGLAYGLVAGGALVHSGGLGERWLGGPAPDAGTVFRIASMTKSFTASTVLQLRDEGALRLDDRADDYVSELRGLRLPTADSPRPTLRNLLTMTAGFPTDDPWGDRQQGLALAEFARLLRDGEVRLAWAAGTRFEYSNLGYAILGKVIANVTGRSYAEAVRSRILAPLGLTRTGYEATEFDSADLSRGYHRDSGGWHELVPDGNGAFAPMGGVFSTVADLARWVVGFADAFPPRDGEDSAHPLSRATRREMQLPQLAIVSRAAGSFPDAAVVSYGFGLFVEEHPGLGTIVQHSGGYPGFGSQMRWHLATGTGVIVLGNGTYAAAGQLATRMLAERLRQLGAGRAGASSTGSGQVAGSGRVEASGPVLGSGRVAGPAPADGRPWPQTLDARDAVDQLLQSWDDEVASEHFTPNVAWDQPFADRRAAIGEIRDRIGRFEPDPGRAPEFDSPAHCRWWLRGDRGVVQADIGLAPLREPLVQSLRLAVPPAPGSLLLRLLDSLIGMLNDGSAHWPDWLPAAADVDTAQVIRQLRIAAAWAGRCAVDVYRAGDGETAATVELAGPSGRVVLTVGVDDADGVLRQASVTLLP